MLTRVIYPVLGISYWQKGYNTYETIPNIDIEFVKNTETTVKIINYIFIVIGVLLDIVVWRHRKYARIIPYLEIAVLFIQGFVPFNYGDFMGILSVMIRMSVFASVCCELGPNLIAVTILYII